MYRWRAAAASALAKTSTDLPASMLPGSAPSMSFGSMRLSVKLVFEV
jgi:hypothetical protein